MAAARTATRAVVHAVAIIGIIAALLIIPAPPATQGQADTTAEYEWGEARRDAPRYQLRRVDLDGTTITQQSIFTWPTITTASWQSNRVSSMAATANNGAITLYRAARHSIYRITSSGQTTVAGLGADIYSPSVAIVDGSLYQANVYGSTIVVRRIANIAGGNTTVEALNTTGRDTESGDNPKATWIGHGKVWSCWSGGVYSWQLPTSPVTALAGRETLTRPAEMPCTESAVPSLVPIDGGRFLMQQGFNLYIWTPSSGAVTALAADDVDTLQSIFPSPFSDDRLFTGQAPGITDVDVKQGERDEEGNRQIAVTLNWTRVANATAYQLERNGAIYLTFDGAQQTATYDLELPAGENYSEDKIRMRAVVNGGASGTTVGSITLAPGERRYSPWTGSYEYALLGESYVIDDTPGSDLPPSVKPLDATNEVEQIVIDTLGLSRGQAQALTPLLLIVFASIIPGMMVVAAPRSPVMLAAACMLFSVVWVFAGWRWFGLPLPLLGLGPTVALILGFVLIKGRTNI